MCRGYDLVYTAKIPLVSSLCGDTLSIPTLDSRTLSIPITDIVKTGSVQVRCPPDAPLPARATC